jgi:DNA-binding transcriptional regulator YbjK
LDLVRFNNQGKQMTSVATLQELNKQYEKANAKEKLDRINKSLKDRYDGGPSA